MDGGASSYLVSSPLIYDKGAKTYGVQMKTQLKFAETLLNQGFTLFQTRILVFGQLLVGFAQNWFYERFFASLVYRKEVENCICFFLEGYGESHLDEKNGLIFSNKELQMTLSRNFFLYTY